MKRFLSIGLIFLVLLSAIDAADAPVVADKNEDGKAGLLFSGYSADISHDFCESNKTAFAEEEETVIKVLIPKIWFEKNEQLDILRYASYWQDHFSRLPSKKLFLDFGSLII